MVIVPNDRVTKVDSQGHIVVEVKSTDWRPPRSCTRRQWPVNLCFLTLTSIYVDGSIRHVQPTPGDGVRAGALAADHSIQRSLHTAPFSLQRSGNVSETQCGGCSGNKGIRAVDIETRPSVKGGMPQGRNNMVGHPTGTLQK